MATKNFVKQEVMIEEKDSQIHISCNKIFDWFKADFGGNDLEVARFVAKYTKDKNKKEKVEESLKNGGKNIKVNYRSYDWSTNNEKKTKESQ